MKAKRIPLEPPATGGFYAWKFAEWGKHLVLIRLYIPASAQRLRGVGWKFRNTNKKCRASEAEVVSFHRHPKHPEVDLSKIKSVRSWHTSGFRYRIGATVRPHAFDASDRVCAPGIHFYMNRCHAEAF